MRWARSIIAGLSLVIAGTGDVHADAELTSAGGGAVREAGFTVDVAITGAAARVVTRQTVVSRSPEAETALYRFELPDNAALVGLTVKLPGGRATTAEIVDAEAAIDLAPGATGLRARGAAADAGVVRLIERDASRDPSAPGRATYELRAYPVPARGNTEITTTWVTPLRFDDGRLSLRIPGRGNAANLVTEKVSISLAAGQGVSGYDQLFAGGQLLAAHAKARRYSLLAPRRGDLVIETEPRIAGGKVPAVSFAAVPITKDLGAIAVQAWAPRATGKQPLDHDRVIVVVDVSASMDAGGIQAAARMAQSLLEVVPAEARVELVTYHRSASRLFGKLSTNSADNRAKIAAAITPAPPPGNGSDLGAALDLVQKTIDRDESRGGRGSILVAIFSDGMTPLDLDARQAIDRVGERVLADGQVLAVTLVPDQVPAPDTSDGPLGGLAARTGGRSIALRHGQVSERAGALAAELARPAPLENLALSAGSTRIDGVPLPDHLDPARGFFTVGFYRGAKPRTIALRGTILGKKIDIAGKSAAPLAALAAPLAIVNTTPGGLLDADLAGGDPLAADDDNGERTLYQRAARKAKVVTPTTALVALDPNDAFARDRLALTRKWGASMFQRMPAPGEDGTGDLGPAYQERISSGRNPWVATYRPTGTLDRAIIARLINTYVVARARACYEKQLKTSQQLEGALVLYLELGRGEVQWAEVQRSTFPGTAIEACVAEAAYSIQVPRVAQGDDRESIGVVTYPLRFQRKQNRGHVGTGATPPPVTVDPNDPL